MVHHFIVYFKDPLSSINVINYSIKNAWGMVILKVLDTNTLMDLNKQILGY